MNKIQSLLLSAPALALLSSPAVAQIATDISGTALRLQTAAVLQQDQGETGTGLGGWLAPTHMELGHAQAVLFDDSGRRSYELDASLTRYVLMGFGIDFGGVSGLLTPEDGRGMPLIVSGEWSRLSGPSGEFQALILKPTGGLPSVRVVGAISARIAYDQWSFPNDSGEVVNLRDQAQAILKDDGDLPTGNAQPSTAAPSFRRSLSSAPTASMMNRDSASEFETKLSPIVASGGSSAAAISSAPAVSMMNRANVSEFETKLSPVVASGGSSSAAISSAPTASMMNRDSVSESNVVTAPGSGGSGWQRSLERSAVAENARGSESAVEGGAEVIANAEGDGFQGTIERAPGAYVNARDRVSELEEPVGTDFTLDPNRTGVFHLTYRILN